MRRMIITVIFLSFFANLQAEGARADDSCLTRLFRHPKTLNEIEARWGYASFFEIAERTTVNGVYANNRALQAALKNPETAYRGDLKLVTEINDSEATLLQQKVMGHPVVGNQAVEKYDLEGTKGFCFGRATAVHLEAMRRGVHQDAIKKIWAVGPMEEGDIYHVATMIKTNSRSSLYESEWVVIDSIFPTPMSVEGWMEEMQNMSVRKPLMFFTSHPSRFMAQVPYRYEKQDLFGSPGMGDSNNGYFKDYFEFMRREAKPPRFTRDEFSLPTQ